MRGFVLSLSFALLLLPLQAGAQIRFDVPGGSEELIEQLQQASIVYREAEADDRLPQDIIAAARADYARLLAQLYEYGYFGPEISIRINGREAATLTPFDAPTAITSIEIRIDPGRPFTLGRAEIGPLAPETTLPDGFRPGAPATTPILREAAEAGISAWRQTGHAVARVAGQEIVARHPQAQLDVAIRLDPGPVLRFGALVPEGEDRMRPERIREIAGLPTGEVFNPDELDRAQDRLRRTGVFRSVALRERPPTPDGTMDITAELVEAPPRRFGFGAEVSSTEGARLTGYWLHRNLFGGAERLRFDAEISGISSVDGGLDWLLSAEIDRPATFTPDTLLRANVAIEYLDEPSFVETLISGGVGVEHRFSDTITAELGIALRYSDITDGFGDRTVTMVQLPAALTYDSRDDPLDARSGLYGSLELIPFAVLDGDGGIRATLDARGYYAFGQSGDTRLAGRLQLGTVEGASILDLPPDFLFFSGGGGTVRGQDYQSLGAIQAGQSSGGRGFLGLSAELRHDLTDRIGLAAFYDAGYVSADPIWDDSGTWHSGAGIGLRYNTPIGAIRLDVATPVSGPGSGDRVYFYIGIGQAF